MSDAIIVAIVSGGLSLLGTLISSVAASWRTDATAKRTDESIKTSQAVTDTKLEELTREVREHNGFARRMPVVEEQIKVINHRVEDLEEINKHK